MTTRTNVISAIGRLMLTAVLAASIAAPAVAGQTGSEDRETQLARRRAALLAARAAVRTVATRGVTVVGVAWIESEGPVVSPHLRLRSLDSGYVEAKTVGNAAGEFSFNRVPGGSYVVELVEPGNEEDVRAVGEILTAAPGDVVATLLVVPRLEPIIPGLFSQTASTVASTAATAGITGVTEGRPVSREQ